MVPVAPIFRCTKECCAIRWVLSISFIVHREGRMNAEDQHQRKKPPRLTILTDDNGDRDGGGYSGGRYTGAAADASGGDGSVQNPSRPLVASYSFSSLMDTSTAAMSPWSPINSQAQREMPSEVAALLSTAKPGATVHTSALPGEEASVDSVAENGVRNHANAAQAHAHFSEARHPAAEKYRKRGRVESANATFDDHPSIRVSGRHHATGMLQSGAAGGRALGAHSGLAYNPVRNKRGLSRSHSSPNFFVQVNALVQKGKLVVGRIELFFLWLTGAFL